MSSPCIQTLLSINRLPVELGRLFQLVTLTLQGNPLDKALLSLAMEGADSVISLLATRLPGGVKWAMAINLCACVYLGGSLAVCLRCY